MGTPTRATAEERHIAEQFVKARLEARLLHDYPGAMPNGREAAYRIQDAAIALWPEPIAGWKTTMVIPAIYGSDFVGTRVIGPAFRGDVRNAAAGETVNCPLIAGGFSGLEPEMVVRIGQDAPADKVHWSIEEAMEMVGELCLGAEVVSSPLPGLGTISVPVMASDFGANCGVVAGPPVTGWRDMARFKAEVHVDGTCIASGGIDLREGVLDTLAFALGECAARGYPLQKGAVITTGTLTTFHAIEPGQFVRLVFVGHGELAIRAVAAQARS